MGCFNGTCALTQLPIFSGDKIYLYILKLDDSEKYYDKTLTNPLTRTSSGSCDSNDYFSPFGLPIRGSYDDYGGIENIVNDGAAELIIKALEFDGTIKDLLEQIYNNDRDDDNLEALKIKALRGYTYIMFHKFAVDEAVKNFKDDPNVENLVKEVFQERDELWYPRSSLCDHGKLEGEYLEILTDKKHMGLLKTHVCLSLMMDKMRKMWFPQTGLGSQDGDLDMYKSLADKVSKFCTKKKKQWEES